MKASEFDKLVDSGESVLEYLDLENAERPYLKQKRVNVDFPAWVVSRLDQESKKRGITRQSLIKMWITDQLESN